MLKRLLSDETGQGLVEFSLIIAIVSLAAISILMILSSGLSGSYQRSTDSLNTAGRP